MPSINKISLINLQHSARNSLHKKEIHQDIKNNQPATQEKIHNVIPLFSYLPLQDVSPHKKYLAYGWKELTPLMSAVAKTFYLGKKSTVPVWMMVWVNEPGVLNLIKAIPKSSFLYKHIRTHDPETQKILQICEKTLVDAYLSAKDFLDIDKDDEIQSGFEVSGEKDCAMREEGAFGIEISYTVIDDLLGVIYEEDSKLLDKTKQYLKGLFVHEIVHKIREINEINADLVDGEEIASHAIEALATYGNNPEKDEYFEQVVESQEDSYDQDVIAALKLLEFMLLKNKYCYYSPKSFHIKEINKAIKSIPEVKREKILKKIAKEIVLVPTFELIKFAAGIDKVKN